MATGDDPRDDAARRLGSALRTLQRNSGRTLRSLETQVRISDSSLSRYFCGSTVPPWASVRDLCETLGADPTEYRALWEAADRGQTVQPPTAPSPLPVPPVAPGPPSTPVQSPTTPATSVASPVSADSADSAGFPDSAGSSDSSDCGQETPVRDWRRAVRTRLAGRWTYAIAACLAGLLTGAAVTWLAVGTTLSSPPASQAAGVDAVPGDARPRGGPGMPDLPRIFVNRATGACLDDSLEHGLRSYPCNGLSYQKWTPRSLGDGTREIRNHATGACLQHDVSTGLRARGCDRSAPQRWSVTAWGDDSAQVRNKVTGACLDDSATAGLRALPCEEQKRQKWA